MTVQEDDERRSSDNEGSVETPSDAQNRKVPSPAFELGPPKGTTWTRPNWAEGLIAFATMVYVVVTFFQWRAIVASTALTVQNLELTRRSVAVAEGSHALSKQAIEAATESNRIAMAALNQDRAWVVAKRVGEEHVTVTVEAGKSVPIRVYYTNVGRSPAFGVALTGCTAFGQGPPPRSVSCPPLTRPGITVVGSGQDAFVALTAGPYSVDELQRLSAGSVHLWLLSRAVYYDRFGVRHQCESCSVYAPEQNTWNNCNVPPTCD